MCFNTSLPQRLSGYGAIKALRYSLDPGETQPVEVRR